jgi:hypothetical protein
VFASLAQWRKSLLSCRPRPRSWRTRCKAASRKSPCCRKVSDLCSINLSTRLQCLLSQHGQTIALHTHTVQAHCCTHSYQSQRPHAQSALPPTSSLHLNETYSTFYACRTMLLMWPRSRPKRRCVYVCVAEQRHSVSQGLVPQTNRGLHARVRAPLPVPLSARAHVHARTHGHAHIHNCAYIVCAILLALSSQAGTFSHVCFRVVIHVTIQHAQQAQRVKFGADTCLSFVVFTLLAWPLGLVSHPSDHGQRPPSAWPLPIADLDWRASSACLELSA